MSHTTDLTLCLGCLDDDALDEFNLKCIAGGIAFDNDAPRLKALTAAVNELPGSKYYTNLIAAACWNNSAHNLPKLVAVFQAYEWESPEDAVLIIADEQQDTQVFRPTAHRL